MASNRRSNNRRNSNTQIDRTLERIVARGGDVQAYLAAQKGSTAANGQSKKTHKRKRPVRNPAPLSSERTHDAEVLRHSNQLRGTREGLELLGVISRHPEPGSRAERIKTLVFGLDSIRRPARMCRYDNEGEIEREERVKRMVPVGWDMEELLQEWTQ